VVWLGFAQQVDVANATERRLDLAWAIADAQNDKNCCHSREHIQSCAVPRRKSSGTGGYWVSGTHFVRHRPFDCRATRICAELFQEVGEAVGDVLCPVPHPSRKNSGIHGVSSLVPNSNREIAAGFGFAAKCLTERNVNQLQDDMSMIVVASDVSSCRKALCVPKTLFELMT
jgi:hypothetical protein